MPITHLKFAPATILVRQTTEVSILYHYGLWVAEDEVIHAQKFRTAVSTTVDEFAAGLRVEASHYRAADPDAAIARARSALGTWQYHALNSNCEAFVLWCAMGQNTPGLQSSVIQLGAHLLFPNAAPVLLGPLQSTKSKSSDLKTVGEKFKQQQEETKAKAEAILARSRARLDKGNAELRLSRESRQRKPK